MKKIPLAEAVKLKSVLTKKISELTNEIHSVSKAIVEKGQTPKVSGRSLSEVEKELAQVRKDSRTLDRLIYRANIDHMIQFKGEELPIVEAIELASQLRAEASLCKEMSKSEKERLYHSTGDNVIFYQVTLYEPEEYRVKANELEKEAHRLSNLINAKNYQVELEFDDSNYF
ncbi:hypothetical protein ACOQFO_04015 [Ureibacillus sp. MALMAid1270]|uniref:DIP1984 family protein n=1 Tax=Ureibacillus sp. MALMAid1270 TaxID=3411629 RepID=UPI003BA41F50